MDLIDQTFFSEDQKWIIHLRVTEKMCYRQIQTSWKIAHLNDEDEKLTSEALMTCLKRSALCFTWKKGKIYGNDYYLSKPDIEILKEYISDKCSNDEPVDAKELLEEALLIRKERQAKAIQFLIKINCPNIAELLQSQEFERPTRSWINANLEKLESKISSARIVDYDRYFACTPDIITLFFSSLEKCINDVPAPLVFGADELSLEPTLKKKFIVPENIPEFISRDVPNQIPHISVMFSHNITGEKIPPFVILPNIQNCPNEIQRPISFGQIWCASTQSGWQNRNSFLLWVINFVNWVSAFRHTLDKSIQNSKAILILDGHTSRENPIAIYILHIHNIDTLVLPAHTTHLLQMFDVVLAKPFKKLFSDKFLKIFSQKDLTKETMAAAIRESAINSLIKSWSDVCSVQNCESAADKTGIYPLNLEKVLSNPFIHTLTDEEKLIIQNRRRTNRLNINGKKLNDPETFNQINQSIFTKDSFRHLCLLGEINYIDYCNQIFSNGFDDVVLFSKFHYYVDSNNTITHF